MNCKICGSRLEEHRDERGNGNLHCKNCKNLWDIRLVNTNKNGLEKKVIVIPPKEKNPFANKTIKLNKKEVERDRCERNGN